MGLKRRNLGSLGLVSPSWLLVWKSFMEFQGGHSWGSIHLHSLEVWLVFVVKLFTILRSWFRKTFPPEGLLAFWTATHARWPTSIRILSLCGSGFAARQFLGLQPLKVLLRAGVEPEQSVWPWVFNFQFWHPNGKKTRGEAYCSMYICRAPLFCTQGGWGVCFLYLFVIFVFQSRFLAYVAFLALCGFLAFFLGEFLVFLAFVVSWQYAATIAQQQVKHQLKEQKDNDNVL